MAISETDFIKADCRTRFLGAGPEGGKIWMVIESLGGFPFGLWVVREGCEMEDVFWRDGQICGQMGDFIKELNHPDAFVFRLSQEREDITDWYFEKGEIRDINTGVSVIWD